MRIIFAAVAFALLAAAPSNAASLGHAALLESIPESKTTTFRAFAGDTDLGTHKIRWTVGADTVVANIEIDLSARVLLVPVFRYKHRSQESWKDGALTAIATTTDDDGEKFSVNGELKDGGFDIKGTRYTGRAPLPVAPTSYWAYASLKKPTWFNSQSGGAFNITVTPKGAETIKTKAGNIKANRYDVKGGELDISLWYDDRKRWVKSRFKASDNVVTYVLQ